MKTTSVLAVISSLLFAAGCATPGVHEADKGLEGTLRSEINERHVHVDVDRGVVKLEGHVRTAADRDRIEALVRNTSGVVAVKDNLHVTFPTPGSYGAYPSTAVPSTTIPSTTITVPSATTTIPIYTGELPVTTPPTTTIITPPAAVVLPEYPKIKVQAATDADQAEAAVVAQQLRAAALPLTADDHVTVTVSGGNVSLAGVVTTSDERGALIEAVQHATGVRAIYDALKILG